MAGSMTTCLMTDFAARPNGTVATATNKITFKSFTFTTQILPVMMIAIQEKPKKSEFPWAIYQTMLLLLVQRQQLKRLENCAQRVESRLVMKSQLIAIVAAVLLATTGFADPNLKDLDKPVPVHDLNTTILPHKENITTKATSTRATGRSNSTTWPKTPTNTKTWPRPTPPKPSS